MNKLKWTKKQLREIENDPVVNAYKKQIESINTTFGPGYTNGIEQDLASYINKTFHPNNPTLFQRVFSAVKVFVFDIN